MKNLFTLFFLWMISSVAFAQEYYVFSDKDGKVFGGIYDNRFLVKKTKSLSGYGFSEALPYPGGSMMYAVDSEDPDEIKEVVEKLISDLK